MKSKKIFVSGCFDLVHAGHVEFLRTAAKYGELYVSIGTDKNIVLLKGIYPTYKQDERLFIIKSLKPVKEAFVSSGSGKIDFREDLERVNPDIFIVNTDGDSREKQELCRSLGIEYKVLERIPKKGLQDRSSTETKIRSSQIPNRISISGGWLDQPYISKKFAGPNITLSIEPEHPFNLRSGIASSTRNSAIRLWGKQIPKGNPIHLAKILFEFDNPPGTPEREIAGAQDSIGIVIPGLVYSNYDGEYWPSEIKQHLDEDILSWIEDKIYMIELKPREDDYNIFEGNKINEENAKKLSEASKKCYKAILGKNFKEFSKSFTDSFNAQTILFPATFPEWIKPIIEKYKKEGASGWKLSGAGGGGYLILVSDVPIKGAIKIKARRK